jgi:hypothetical protein
MSAPKRVVVEYDDDSTKSINFNEVNRHVQFELGKLGLCPSPDSVASGKHYLLLKWKDGWQEVVGVDGDFVQLLRYYVIERIEHRGRLSLDVGDDYPELFIIERTPNELSSILVFGNDGGRAFRLDAEVQRWEGIFDAGGKREYVKYDGTDSRYPQECDEEPEDLNVIVNSVKHELDGKGLDPEELLVMDQNLRIEVYKEIADRIAVRGKERQEDVYGFIELMVKKSAANASEGE